MNSRQRVFAALQRQAPDRTPRFEIWIDGLFEDLGTSDPYRAYAELGQDGVLLPSQAPAESRAWKSGVDEWGRVWKDGMYCGGALDTAGDLERYSPPESYAQRFFDNRRTEEIRAAFPEHCLFFGTSAEIANVLLPVGIS